MDIFWMVVTVGAAVKKCRETFVIFLLLQHEKHANGGRMAA
jgi:hypothetical protein